MDGYGLNLRLVAPVPQAGADIILPPEVLAQRTAEEQQRREMEKQAEQTAREVAGEARKAGEPVDRVKEVIGDVIRGLERDLSRARRKRRYRMILSSGARRRRFSRWPQKLCSVIVCRLWSGTWFVT